MKDIYASITERFISQLEKGICPWQKPWRTPSNFVSKKPYRGVNALWLGACTSHESPYWLTFKQALDLGGNVMTGSKSEMVVYFKILECKDKGQPVYHANGSKKVIPLLRYSNVFNLDQTEGIKAPENTVDVSTDKAQEIITNASICPIINAGTRAYYSPKDDTITMPQVASFHSPAGYCHTLFHEMTHATGHSSRLARKGITNFDSFGTEQYSHEELIAELGAAFISNEANILSDVRFENSAAYLQSWSDALSKDRKLIVSAASAAQRAADYVLKREYISNEDTPKISKNTSLVA